MGAVQQFLSSKGSSGDPKRAFVVAHLHFDGTDGSTTITDTTGRSWTPSGNAQIDTAQSQFGGASLLLDGTGDYVSTANAAALQLTNQAFVIECWIRPNELGRVQTISNKRDGSGAEEHSIYFQATNVIVFNLFNSGSAVVTLTTTTVFTTGVWYAICVERAGNTFRIYVNGAVEDTFTGSVTASTNTAPLYIGRDGFNTARDFNGHIDEYRLTVGDFRYNGAYTPSGPFPDS